jgi:glutamate 5-kinase
MKTNRPRRGGVWVVKLGSGLLSNRRGGIDRPQMARLGAQVAAMMERGLRVILVSSGAVSAGMTALGLSKRPVERQALQACASIGQPLLMRAYNEVFGRLGLLTAQILLTYWDLDSRQLYANTQRTLGHLLESGRCVPVFNENDALSFEEIEMLNRFGDNDRLSGHVALLAGASRLVILSGIEGLNTRPDGSGKWLKRVREIDAEIEGYAGRTQSERSVGGMVSKLETAKMMLRAGIPMVVANGRRENVLLELARGRRVGTLFDKGRA